GAFDEAGFFKTGDLGALDADGYLYFRGRLKEMVKTGGINVAPVEVEEVLMSHPDVQAAFVTGVPDPVHDEVLAAVIITRRGAHVTEKELCEFCRRTLAAYNVPRLVRFASEEELPLTCLVQLPKNCSDAHF